jgi:glycosyltransferase involved in cell wall biosynthesis
MEQKGNEALVSVIVPCYNQGLFLRETLDSVAAQNYSAWECIIVDDGSTDNTKTIGSEYESKDKRFKYISQPNQGVSRARNNGIANSRGKYILPLDGDDKIGPRYIEEAVKRLEGDASVKLVYCLAETFGNKNEKFNIHTYSYKGLLMANMIFCTALFRKDDFLKTKGYSEDMSEGYEDWEFWITFLNESDKVVQLPEVYFYYRIRDNSRNPKVNEEEKQKRIRKSIYNKHKEIYDRYFPLPELLFEYNKVNNQMESMAGSSALNIGRSILKPYWAIKRLFK